MNNCVCSPNCGEARQKMPCTADVAEQIPFVTEPQKLPIISEGPQSNLSDFDSENGEYLYQSLDETPSGYQYRRPIVTINSPRESQDDDASEYSYYSQQPLLGSEKLFQDPLQPYFHLDSETEDEDVNKPCHWNVDHKGWGPIEITSILTDGESVLSDSAVGPSFIPRSLEFPNKHELNGDSIRVDPLQTFFQQQNDEADDEANDCMLKSMIEALALQGPEDEPVDQVVQSELETPSIVEYPESVTQDDAIGGGDVVEYTDDFESMGDFDGSPTASLTTNFDLGESLEIIGEDYSQGVVDQCAIENMDDLEKVAVYDYWKSKQRSKYLFDGANMIRIKPRPSAVANAMVGKAFWLQRKNRDRVELEGEQRESASVVHVTVETCPES